MPANLAHFALNATDVHAARDFYGKVFGWTFSAWGPPGFFKIQTGPDDEPGIAGALQARRELVPGNTMIGAECTFAVEDVDATAHAVRDAGGTILMDRFTITGVGHLIYFADPGGNAIGAMQYDAAAE
ncbi:VOC family protein [Aldersonia sp. NBC_00410]|uniref:VOC family protein n=1 Tax=Aldersonia sp. NBC_00410 TaxID=2975954 RepID=UPI00224FDC53|nr:VOC family protein [Aldersonia sp. NBC_00410]MCX5045763.1 VOC family protein [Aldersonia sp. NBC_00410]